MISAGPNVVDNLYYLLFEYFLDASLVEGAFLDTLILLTAFFEDIFLDQETFNIILLLACLPM